MYQFICGATMSRSDLLKSKAKGLRVLIQRFTKNKHSRFDTPFGYSSIEKLLKENDILDDDDSVVAFVQSVEGEEIGILCFQTGPDDYEFKLVSGSADEISRMIRYKPSNVQQKYKPPIQVDFIDFS